MTCSACGTANEAGRKFCKECGAPLALACPSCGGANEADAKFCGECGSALAGAVGGRAAAARAEQAPAATPPGATTERRLVSVLFVDLVGFTSLSEQRDAEDMRELLSRYFDTARETIERHGGLVEKFIGDAVMAVWGTPVAHEDDAERAVRAALSLVDAVEALGAEIGAELRARAGVLTGEAAATVGAVSQGIVAGDMVNTASRLQSAAEPGAVFVGETTYRSASRAIAFEDRGELTLKGKEEPVRAWRALRVVSDVGGASRTQGIEPPFVGRAEEFRLLKEMVHATGRERRARLVSIVGIGGIGKSRLAWELEKYIDGITEQIYWHRGRCPAYGDGISFWALGEMVRMRAGIAETDAATGSRRKLADTVAEYVADEEERRWIEPRLAHLLGLEERSTGEREELFSAWRTFFERVADRGTTAMVFEDIQWADAGLLDFIESMLEWSRSHPILLVTLSRPELQEKRTNWGAGQRSFTSVYLEPLPSATMAELVRGLVRDAPEDAVERIVERAEGVPLYAVETVRMLADRGVLTADGDGFRFAGDLGAIDTPETLQALIAARLDGLAPDDRSLLQDAAVLGKSFTVQALAAVSGGVVDEVEGRLQELVRKEYLDHEADPRSPERGQYTFVQALIREVAYGTLSKADRRRRHLAAAHHLESLDEGELAGVVAAHYTEAYRATPAGPDADALAARARDWLANAGERAMSLGSPEQALAFTAQALEITPDGVERATLLATAAAAAIANVQDAVAVAYCEEAIPLFERAGDQAGAALATAKLARALNNLDRLPEAMERVRAMREAVGEDLDPRARAELARAFAAGLTFAGGDADALAPIDEALSLLEQLDDLNLLLETITLKAVILFNLGRHRESAMLGRGALELADETGSWDARGVALGNLGVTLQEDDPRAAYQANMDAAVASARAGQRSRELNALGNGVEGAIDVGEWARADEVLADMGARPELGEGDRLSIGVNLAMLQAFRGDVGSAAARLDEVEERFRGTEFVQAATWVLRAKSVALLMADDLEGALRAGMDAIAPQPTGINAPAAVWSAARAALWLRDPDRVRETIAAAELLRGRWMENVRRTIEAGLAAIEGRVEDGLAAYRRALEVWVAMDLPLDRAFCVVDAVTLLPPGSLSPDEIAWAREYLTGLGARPLLDRLTAASAAAAGAPDDARDPSTV